MASGGLTESMKEKLEMYWKMQVYQQQYSNKQ